MPDERKHTPYPEHEKLAAVQKQSQVVGEFIEWLSENGYHICIFSETERLYASTHTIPDWLAEFFKIDAKKLEDEKRQMLDAIRQPKRKRRRRVPLFRL